MSSPIEPRHVMPYRSCVLDPSLALSPYGVAIATSLSPVLNIWIVRELWHILENIDFYLQQPELILTKIVDEQSTEVISTTKEAICCSLKDWETLRNQNDLTALNMFWLGDRLRESLLPPNQKIEIFKQWEWLASLLDRQIDFDDDAKNILTLAFRDAIAMTACLNSAFLLTSCYPNFKNVPEFAPAICQDLANWGIACQLIPATELSLDPEREYLRQLFAKTGLTKFHWAGISLAVLQIILPAASNIYYFSPNFASDSFNKRMKRPKVSNAIAKQTNCWTKSRCFWYQVL